MLKKSLIILVFEILSISTIYAFDDGKTKTRYKYVKHKHSESSYQHAWCSARDGIEEFENLDKTRVDCLTDIHAVEFDFANKWAESIGQALHYQLMTGKKAMVVLILEEPKQEMVYYNRVKKLGKIHNFDVEYITTEILNIKNGKCIYIDCKCHRKKQIRQYH